MYLADNRPNTSILLAYLEGIPLSDGGWIMNNQERHEIQRLRTHGYSYKKIAKALGVSENTIKSFCRRNSMGGVASDDITAQASDQCRQCAASLIQMKGKKQKRFCSDRCRMSWWNSHPEAISRKANQTFACKVCGQQFTSYGKRERKYCSRACYGRARATKR